MEADGLGGDDVHQRSALHAGEDDFVDRAQRTRLLGQNQAGAGAAQRLVRGGGDDLGVGHRRRMRAARDQTGEVRHVHQIERAHLVGDLAHARESR